MPGFICDPFQSCDLRFRFEAFSVDTILKQRSEVIKSENIKLKNKFQMIIIAK